MIPSIVAAIPIPVVIIDPSERVSEINEAAETLIGSAVLGRHYVTALRQPSVLDSVETAFRSRRMAEAAYVSSDASRETVWRARAAPIWLPEGEGVLLPLLAETAQREADQIRRDFVGNVSHELRTPLTAMMGFIETLRGAARDDPNARDRFLSIMENEAGRMNRLVRDLLSLSRVEAQERQRPTDIVDLASVLASVQAALLPLANESGVVRESETDDAPLLVAGDEDQLHQVFLNLIENAIKYGGSGKVVRSKVARQDYDALLRGPSITVTVEDEGEGIPELHIPRLTERFYRVDSHRSREMGGTGLGLAIVKHIVNRHRGRLRVSSEPSIGSTFSVVLPAYATGTAQRPPE